MLTDAQIERYGRQIILPEVGGRGQERLLAARVAVAGAGPAAVAAATLLGRAGVGTLEVSAGLGPLPALSPDCRCGAGDGPADVALGLVELGAGDDGVYAHGAPFGLEAAGRPFVLGLLLNDRILVATLVGRPCMRCWPQALAPGELGGDRAAGGPAQVAPARLALGALAANEALRLLLSPPPHGRLTTIGFDGGATARELATAGCSCCAGQ
ncbi:MAG TPA: ThiF family adenylyltransferase [Candidatus Limnocylindria bacterium]|nr:ThiF family adenylyltransferase [Candidatus Limnocylindria bacterium]